ncbi:hypothetical protein [Streptomyces atratus]|uniref:hypothetical protein n=1 Tax=Streptomyces atratus TaxID=1893 RepID=UPI00224EABD2|nr:hypothetical protein [Streptomyces atratus]MCX5345196.1 hypothetical protein [Streptomyces atratus]
MTNPLSATRSRRLRIVLTVLAAGMSVAAAIWLEDLSHQVAFLRAARRQWHDTGYLMVTLFAVGVPVGTLLHTASAATAGRQVGRAWRNTGVLMAYGALVAVLAWLVAPSGSGNLTSGRGGGSAGAYLAWLTFVLLPFVVLACAGGLFARGHAPVVTQSAEGRQDDMAGSERPKQPLQLPDALVLTGMLGWGFGAIPFILLVVGSLVGVATR